MLFKFLKKPVIHLYSVCWNEEYILNYFFRHYDAWVERYVFFDDGSTDRTLEILEKHSRAEVRCLPRVDNLDSYILAAQNVHNHAWKESRGQADWVIITAVDEFLYAPNFQSYLAKCRREGVTAIPALGYQMISDTPPSANRQLTRLVRRGCPWSNMNKLSLFAPQKIMETNYILGRHTAEPSGEVKYPSKDELLLCHYKYLSFEGTFRRHAELQEKLGSVDKQRGWAHKYSWSRENFKKDWERFESGAIENVFSRAYNPDLQHSPKAERWWRKDQP